MTSLPTDAEIRALHEKYAPSRAAFELVHTHCEIVRDIALQLLSTDGRHALDAELVRVGALVHDIGVYRLLGEDGWLEGVPYVRHGVLGHEILRQEGFPERLCRFCSCHTGVGISREDIRRQGLDLPAADYLAETGEEQLVMYADKFHTKSTPPAFVSADAYAAQIGRFGAEKAVAFAELRARFGEPGLDGIRERYGYAPA
ncbi:HDIG domain-containing protein [Streptomyces sp. AV19]|uniref:HD domain-containing protein n=1 Tax=Streptomyces sp. AV19 TaxID=2793068 RepID=UPI0018FE1DA6|nr:HD domain-containing protein [Streptomyces sp. AV19]MBH1933841.1 HDIG domain-containing protein [Streptomyces sp. AV19]MDG4533192.1 HDIG domain-containing protein [Streptomyces sp. AV19]